MATNIFIYILHSRSKSTLFPKGMPGNLSKGGKKKKKKKSRLDDDDIRHQQSLGQGEGECKMQLHSEIGSIDRKIPPRRRRSRRRKRRRRKREMDESFCCCCSFPSFYVYTK